MKISYSGQREQRAQSPYPSQFDQLYLTQCKGNILSSLWYLWPIISSLLNHLDPNTLAHSFRVANLATAFAESLNEEPDVSEMIYIGALLHDVGKMCIDQSILNGIHPLSRYEKQVLRQHPAVGAYLLEFYNFPAPIIEMVRFHHEKYDGSGYPNQLSRDQIPNGARMISVVDSYDAMTSLRCYRLSVSAEEAKNEIANCAGSHYDPWIAEIFTKLKDASPA